ncbi:MAG TPA: 4'-phosphopantetheinyl transferase superfamily protein [Solirubrobacteraceae bacterium]|nr:4'-phosphopantetheinyl transferase superfamily protein [Solirubrobacteraceae bacterium]
MSTGDLWVHGPLLPLLSDGEVHIWRADLATVSPRLEELLCDGERTRAARILNERDGELWRRSRGLLRSLLGRYLQLEPSSLRFSIGTHGKPALQHPDELPSPVQPAAHQRTPASTDRVCFNMSHSDGLALYAFSRSGAVGVDVEVARRPVDAVAIAARMLGPAQARRLEALDPPLRQREFLRAWVCYEAELKCLGVGIGPSPAGTPAYEPWVAEIELGLRPEQGPTAAAAVAAEQRARELCFWDWQL